MRITNDVMVAPLDYLIIFSTFLDFFPINLMLDFFPINSHV